MGLEVIVNPDASSGTSGWTQVLGTLATISYGGKNWFYWQNATEGKAYQDLTPTASELASIQSGGARLKVDYELMSYNYVDSGGIELEARDALDNVVARYIPYRSVCPKDSTQPGLETVWVSLPPNTSYVRLYLRGFRGQGVNIEGYLTNLSSTFFPTLGFRPSPPADFNDWELSVGNPTIVDPTTIDFLFQPFNGVQWVEGFPRIRCAFALTAADKTELAAGKTTLHYWFRGSVIDNSIAYPYYWDPLFRINVGCFDINGEEIHREEGSLIDVDYKVFNEFGVSVYVRNIPTNTEYLDITIDGWSAERLGNYDNSRIKHPNYSFVEAPSTVIDETAAFVFERDTELPFDSAMSVGVAADMSVYDTKPQKLVADFTSRVDQYVAAMSWNGCFWHGFYYDYYERVYIIPDIVDVGLITDDASVTYRIWNAYSAGITLDSMNVVNPVGVVPPSFTFPESFGQYEIRPFTYTILGDGPNIIDTTFEHQFTVPGGSEFKTYKFTGIRALIPPFKADWKDGYDVVYEYKTEIITSRDGTEQRRALRQSPRRKISVDTWMKRQEQLHFLQSWNQKPVLIPDLIFEYEITANGTQEVPYSDNVPWIKPNQGVLLGNHGCDEAYTFTPALIDTVDTVTNVIRFTTNISAGTYKMWPSITGRYDDFRMRFETDKFARQELTVIESPGKFIYEPPSASTLLNGLEVFDRKPDWRGGLSVNFDPMRDDVDFGVGVRDYNIVRPPRVILQYQYTNLNHEAFLELYHLYLRQKGRRGLFWVPSFTDDLTPSISSGPADTKVDFVGHDLYNSFKDDELRAGLCVRMPDGTSSYAEIVDIVKGVSNTSFILNGPIGVDVMQSKRIEWLYKVRFGTDRLNVRWITDQVSAVTVNFEVMKRN